MLLQFGCIFRRNGTFCFRARLCLPQNAQQFTISEKHPNKTATRTRTSFWKKVTQTPSSPLKYRDQECVRSFCFALHNINLCFTFSGSKVAEAHISKMKSTRREVSCLYPSRATALLLHSHFNRFLGHFSVPPSNHIFEKHKVLIASVRMRYIIRLTNVGYERKRKSDAGFYHINLYRIMPHFT